MRLYVVKQVPVHLVLALPYELVCCSIASEWLWLRVVSYPFLVSLPSLLRRAENKQLLSRPIGPRSCRTRESASAKGRTPSSAECAESRLRGEHKPLNAMR